MKALRVLAVVEFAIILGLGLHLHTYADRTFASLRVGEVADIIGCVAGIFLLFAQAVKFLKEAA
jgi:hypothetical protein